MDCWQAKGKKSLGNGNVKKTSPGFLWQSGRAHLFFWGKYNSLRVIAEMEILSSKY